MDQDKNHSSIIEPWTKQYDEGYKRNYFFNAETKESVWNLPEEIQQKVDSFNQKKEQEQEEEKEQDKSKEGQFLKPKPKNIQKTEINFDERYTEYMKRAAPIQREESFAKQYAYKEGSAEYNIWYDKYLSMDKGDDKEPALSRCEPEVHSGYTNADMYEKFSTYFCIHFSHGCCTEGVNCKYYHHPPTLDECKVIDSSKDVFGRARFAEHREDREGIGSFMHETKVLEVQDFKIPEGIDPIGQMYEILWRHFSVWGMIESVNLHVGKGLAFVRYQHRCMSEFAKEAMTRQALDLKEILTIKWAVENEIDKEQQNKQEKQFASVKQEIYEKEQQQLNQTIELNKRKLEREEEEGQQKWKHSDDQRIRRKMKRVKKQALRMQKILNDIEASKQGQTSSDDDDEEEYLQQQQQTHFIPPEKNNMPLF